jgi:WXG100 family type VII secretion target
MTAGSVLASNFSRLLWKTQLGVCRRSARAYAGCPDDREPGDNSSGGTAARKEATMSGPNGAGVVNQGGGVLEQAAREVASAKSDLDRIAATLRGRIEPMAASWKGAGAGAFFAFHEEWQQKEKRIVEILTGFSDAIGATHVTTTHIDSEESAHYRTIAGRLG